MPFLYQIRLSAAAPDGAPPWRIDEHQKLLPAKLPRRGPDGGVLCIGYNFQGSRLNSIGSYLFLLSESDNDG
jgi:hypothetical protein